MRVLHVELFRSVHAAQTLVHHARGRVLRVRGVQRTVCVQRTVQKPQEHMSEQPVHKA